MALTADQIASAWREMAQDDVTIGQTFAKPDLVAAVQAADAWCTANAASYNAALPNPFKSNATAAQKAALLAYVALRRYGR